MWVLGLVFVPFSMAKEAPQIQGISTHPTKILPIDWYKSSLTLLMPGDMSLDFDFN